MLTCVFTCFFLVLNIGLVFRFYPLLVAWGPQFLRHSGMEQMIMFAGPVLMVFVEWWLVDLVVDLLAPLSNARRRGGDRSPSRQPAGRSQTVK